MEFVTVRDGKNFGYFTSMDDVKDNLESPSIQKVFLNYQRFYSEHDVGVNQEDCITVPEKLYTIGVPGKDMIFHTTGNSAAFYCEHAYGMTEEILMYMGCIVNAQGSLIKGSWKSVYALSYIYNKCAYGDNRPLEEIFEEMKLRGDMYEVHLGKFEVPKAMGYVYDKIEEEHRLIYGMALNYAKLAKLIGVGI